jgi:hypothetical protein
MFHESLFLNVLDNGSTLIPKQRGFYYLFFQKDPLSISTLMFNLTQTYPPKVDNTSLFVQLIDHGFHVQ